MLKVEFVDGFNKENIEERHFCGRLTAVFYPIIKNISDTTGVTTILDNVLDELVERLAQFDSQKPDSSTLVFNFIFICIAIKTFGIVV